MTKNWYDFLQQYIKLTISFVISFCLIRLFEYTYIAHKSFVPNAYLYEIAGWLYDIWFCLIYSGMLLFPVFFISQLNQKIAIAITHVINCVIVATYISLLYVFSERNTPFDHELFTRSFAESLATAKQMATSGYYVFIPYIIFLGIYFSAYFLKIKNISINNKKVNIWGAFVVAAILLMPFANPTEDNFKEEKGYYFTTNKFSYWIADTYNYFTHLHQFEASRLSPQSLKEAIQFYQKNQGFHFTSSEYPLLRENTQQDVLGSFFNLDKATPPNIVIIVVEGLSKDFSGANAYAGSFTPFLDHLSTKSLVWDHFLSTAPGTFAAHPAISGSLPYGKRGFSVINVMPNHLSLIKILRANGYHSKFLIGFNPDFDNMGGYMRLQGTDMILTHYGPRYKMMGVGEEGWSMGYPDDALFNRSFEVMDSVKKTPYLNIYHTGTTHMPYLFAQQNEYGKLFDQKMKSIPNSKSIKKTLKECKQVLVTYMFADDCLKNFFNRYEKRADYKNTIFFIMGDHHIGSFPSTNGLDDYHVPFIVYSPMLKAPKKFYSISTHNNIAPTITNLILNNYPNLKTRPSQVHWLTDVIDTAVNFRNIHSMPFMEWSREITDYIYKGYYLSGKQLYQIKADLAIQKVRNDSVKTHMTKLINNFKLINDYVTSDDKIYPKEQSIDTAFKTLLQEFNFVNTININTKSSDITILPEFKVPKEFKYLFIELSAAINLQLPGLDDQPAYRLSLIDTTGGKRNFVFWTNHNIVQMTKGDYIEKQWNLTSTTDMFTLNDYKKYKNLVFDLSFFNNAKPIQLQMKGLHLKIYGIQ